MPTLHYLMKRFYLYIIIILSVFSTKAQDNLVLNGNFENYNTCPVQRVSSYIMYYPFWYNTNNLTPDSYNECSSSSIQFSVNIPNNYCGNQSTANGKGYIGLWLTSPGIPEVGEFITGLLNNQLDKDSTYEVSFYISTADNSKHAIDRIGAFISKDSIFHNDNFILPYTPQVESDSGHILDYQTSWHEIKGLFKAKGGKNTLHWVALEVRINSLGKPIILLFI